MSYKYIIEVKNLWKIYGEGETRVEALRGISFNVEKGDWVSISGPSGCGKTTLLNCLGGLDRPTSGKILVNGKDITSLSDRELTDLRRYYIGFVFQFFNLLPEFTALENVMIPMIISNKFSSKKEVVERAKNLLESVGLTKRLNYYPHQLSGGERQRVAIARALANSPLIVLMDEPTGNLDSESTEMLIELIKKLNETEGQTFIVVTHNNTVAKAAKTKYNMLDGRIRQTT